MISYRANIQVKTTEASFEKERNHLDFILNSCEMFDLKFQEIEKVSQYFAIDPFTCIIEKKFLL